MILSPSKSDGLPDRWQATDAYGGGHCEFGSAIVVQKARRNRHIRAREIAVVSWESEPGLGLNEFQILEIIADPCILPENSLAFIVECIRKYVERFQHQNVDHTPETSDQYKVSDSRSSLSFDMSEFIRATNPSFSTPHLLTQPHNSVMFLWKSETTRVHPLSCSSWRVTMVCIS